MCEQEGRVVAATAVDHIEPHRGDMIKFWRPPKGLQSLCATHHSAGKQRAEKRGYDTRIDETGYPVDPRHPFNRAASKSTGD
jgi:hypothetical protein